jgi:autotransporter adhesin
MGIQHTMQDRQVTNVAAGSEATDAVNVGQLTDALAGVSGGASQNGASIATAFGGGATYGLQGMTAPSYLIQGNAYSDVGGAFAALDGSLTGALSSIHHLEQQAGNGNGGHGPGHGNGVAVGDGSMATDGRDTAIGKNATIGADGSTAVGSNATIDATATNAVAIGADTHVSAPSATAVGQGASASGANSVALGAGSVAADANTVSVGSGALQRRVTNVAAGTTPTDAANVGQVDQALQSAKSYADNQDATTLGNAKAYTDQRFDSMKNQLDDRFRTIDRRVDRIGAMGAASTQMAINAAGASSVGGRVAVGAGVQGGERALSVGYARQLGDRTRMSIGGAFSGSENSAGIGFGVDL